MNHSFRNKSSQTWLEQQYHQVHLIQHQFFLKPLKHIYFRCKLNILGIFHSVTKTRLPSKLMTLWLIRNNLCNLGLLLSIICNHQESRNNRFGTCISLSTHQLWLCLLHYIYTCRLREVWKNHACISGKCFCLSTPRSCWERRCTFCILDLKDHPSSKSSLLRIQDNHLHHIWYNHLGLHNHSTFHRWELFQPYILSIPCRYIINNAHHVWRYIHSTITS